MQSEPLDYTRHAHDAMSERGIPVEWVERVVNNPTFRTLDPDDPEVERFYGVIPEHGSRTLRVAINTQTLPWRVVSVFFDRGMRGKL